MRNEICLEVGSVACEFLGLLPCLFTSICVGLINSRLRSANRSSWKWVTYKLLRKFVVQPQFVELSWTRSGSWTRSVDPKFNCNGAIGPDSSYKRNSRTQILQKECQGTMLLLKDTLYCTDLSVWVSLVTAVILDKRGLVAYYNMASLSPHLSRITTVLEKQICTKRLYRHDVAERSIILCKMLTIDVSALLLWSVIRCIVSSFSIGLSSAKNCWWKKTILLVLVEAVMNTCFRLILSCFDLQNPGLVPYLISIMHRSTCTQECVTTILSNCCLVSVVLLTSFCVNAKLSQNLSVLCALLFNFSLPSM